MPDLVNGLGGPVGFGEGVLGANDDDSTPAIDITSVFGPGGLNFFGTNYTSLFVNNNGNITFGSPLYEYIAAPIGGGGLSVPIIAAYWFDVDTRGGQDTASPGGTSTGSNLVYYDLDTDNRVFTATWDDVGYFSQHIGSPDAFQIRLIDVGGGDFDIEFIYESINQSYSDTNSDPGEAPRAGYARGNGTPGVELPESGDFNAALNLDTDLGNTGVAGEWYFQVRGGVVYGGAGGGGGGVPVDDSHGVSFSLTTNPLQHEGDSGSTPFDVTIHRSGDLTGPSTVSWAIDPRQTDDADFVAGQAFSGTVTFGVGESTIVIPIGVQGDHLYEQDEMFLFSLTSATHGSDTWTPDVSVAQIIVNDDPAVSFLFSGPVARPEGQVGETPFDFTVIRGGNVAAASVVTWSLAYGATDAQDFAGDQPLTGEVTFAPGQTEATIEVRVTGDVKLEPDEDFTLSLTSATTGATTTPLDVSTTGTILDDDTRQALLVATPATLVQAEGDSGTTPFTFTIMRVGDLSGAVDVPYAVTFDAHGGADPSDFSGPLSGTVSFAAGASRATVTILVGGDAKAEEDETFHVTLGGGALNTLVLNGVIMNDDEAGGAASPSVQSQDPGEAASAFIQHLMSGGLWADAGLV